MRHYTTPGHPTAFAGPLTVARYFGLSTQKAREILKKLDTYTLHRQTVKAKCNPYYFDGRGTYQIDLVDTGALKASNDGIKFLLMIIEEFTRMLWVYPCKTKSAGEMLGHFERWLRSIWNTPARATRVFHDHERAFISGRVKQVLQDFGVRQQLVTGNSCGIVERCNRT